jgi:hypothetical protein
VKEKITGANFEPAMTYVLCEELFDTLVKIGKSTPSNLKFRRQNLQTGSSRQHLLVGLCFVPEKSLHEKYSHRGIPGRREWFRLSEEEYWALLFDLFRKGWLEQELREPVGRFLERALMDKLGEVLEELRKVGETMSLKKIKPLETQLPLYEAEKIISFPTLSHE